jgi:hypothetical protein
MLKNSILTFENLLTILKISKALSIFLFIPFLNFSQQSDIHTKRFYESNSHLNVRDIQITKDNGFLVVGNAQILFGQQNYVGSFIFYNDSSGNISSNYHWEKVYTTFGNVEDFSFEKVQELPDSSFLVSGKMFNVISNTYGGALLRMDRNGNEIWKKSLETAFNEPIIISDINVETDSTFLILGSKMGLVDQSYLCRIDTVGNILWQKSFSLDGANILELLAVEKLQNGSILLSGNSYSNQFTTQGVLMMLDSLGNLAWAIQNDQIYSSFNDVITDQNTIYCRNLNSNGSSVNSVSAFDLAGNNLWNYLINDVEMLNFPTSRRKIRFDQDSNLVVYYGNFSYGNFHRLTRQGNYVGEFAAIGIAQGVEIDHEDGRELVLSSGPSFGVKSSLVLNNHFAVTKLDSIQSSKVYCIWDYSSFNSQQQTTFTSVNVLSGDSCHLSDALMENVTVFITIDNNCVEFLGGLGEDKMLDFEVFPNPTSQKATIRLAESMGINNLGSISNVLGDEVLTFKISTTETILDFSTLLPGIYWIKIGDSIQKLILN